MVLGHCTYIYKLSGIVTIFRLASMRNLPLLRLQRSALRSFGNRNFVPTTPWQLLQLWAKSSMHVMGRSNDCIPGHGIPGPCSFVSGWAQSVIRAIHHDVHQISTGRRWNSYDPLHDPYDLSSQQKPAQRRQVVEMASYIEKLYLQSSDGTWRRHNWKCCCNLRRPPSKASYSQMLPVCLMHLRFSYSTCYQYSIRRTDFIS